MLRLRPVGTVANPIDTVRGSRFRVTDALTPLLSVAVNVSSRCDGYSWSGGSNEPLATPSNVWMTWVWQFDGQCFRTSVQVSMSSARAPSSASLAEPLKSIGIADPPGRALAAEHR